MMNAIVHPAPLHYSAQAAERTRARQDARAGLRTPADYDAGGRDYESRVPHTPVRPKLDPPQLHGFASFEQLIAEA